MTFWDKQSAGRHDLAPRDEEDLTYKGGDQVIPGAHPLQLSNSHVYKLSFPLVSPFMPSPERPHPYFTEPIPELPHFDCNVAKVYHWRVMRVPIVVPVFNLDGEVTHTRELDPYVFGFYPQSTLLHKNTTYWQVRHQKYSAIWDYERREIYRKAKKNWPNTGMGLPRVSDRKGANFHWGARARAGKPWNMKMPYMHPETWERSCRMAITLKMLQGKLQIVDKLQLPEPTTEAFLDLCKRMQWDVRHTGAGVLFMDGGSRVAPSQEFNKSFFYGSFYNGRCKVVRPTLEIEAPFDDNWKMSNLDFRGPKGPKNPIPINRFNAFDALEHHLLVITEGAVAQLEKECEYRKFVQLPPHIREQLPQTGALDTHLLGDCVPDELATIEEEAAARTEEREARMYEPYYDNPYKPWRDEHEAAYQVDAVDGVIRRTVNGKPGSWRVLE